MKNSTEPVALSAPVVGVTSAVRSTELPDSTVLGAAVSVVALARLTTATVAGVMVYVPAVALTNV